MNLTKIKFVLMDIEGTTTSISFVHDVLFPYSKLKIKDYVHDHQEELIEAGEMVNQTLVQENDTPVALTELAKVLEKWIEEDRKHPVLKLIQGKIWKLGYESGELEGHLYPDVPECFKSWKKLGLKMGIYSSGSVEAQKLLYGFSQYGDLRTYLDFYFDLGVGSKREVASYQNILKQLKLPAEQVLFLSDIHQELDAAAEAGLTVIQLVRGSDVVIGNHPTAADFFAIKI